MAEQLLDRGQADALAIQPGRARVPQHVWGEPGDRAVQVPGGGLAQRRGERVAADRAAALGREQDRAGQLPVIGELAADLSDPPDQQRARITEHRHHPLPRPRPARALAQPHVDLAERPVLEVQVLQPQPAQFPQPQPGLGGQPGHRVVPGCGQPLARRGQLTAPAGKERGQRGRGRRDTDMEVARMAGPVAVIDRGCNHVPGQLMDLAAVAGFQEAEEQVDRPGLAAPGLGRPVPLVLAKEPVSVCRLGFPCKYARVLKELLHCRDLAADRAVGDAVGEPGQHVLGHQVLLVGRRVIGVGEGPRGSQVPDHSQRHATPRLQQSRTERAITEDHTGLPMQVQRFVSDTQSPVSGHLSCSKGRPARPRADTNCRQVQQYRPILARLDCHAWLSVRRPERRGCASDSPLAPIA